MKVASDLGKINGDIEILRIVFATIVVIHHLAGDFGLGIAQNGGVTDEFLFVVTGILMAKSAKNREIDKKAIPRSNWQYILRKIEVFYPYYLFSIIAQFIIIYIFDNLSILDLIKKFLYSIPNIVLIYVNGIYYEKGVSGGGGWFLSAMLIAILFLYPILRYNYEWATRYIFPCIGVIGIGALFINFNTLNTALEPMPNNIILSGLVRASSEIALGAVAFEFSQVVEKKRFSKLSKVILTIIKVIVYFLAIIYAFSGLDNSLTPVVLFLILSGCVLTFSKNTYVIKCNKFIYILGRLSVPLFLTHCVVRMIALKTLGDNISVLQLLVLIGLSFVLAMVLLYINNIFRRHIKKKKEYVEKDNAI